MKMGPNDTIPSHSYPYFLYVQFPVWSFLTSLQKHFTHRNGLDVEVKDVREDCMNRVWFVVSISAFQVSPMHLVLSFMKSCRRPGIKQKVREPKTPQPF